MLIGTFHFKDLGADVVKMKDINILTEESQKYLQEFAQRLAEFKPTRFFLSTTRRMKSPSISGTKTISVAITLWKPMRYTNWVFVSPGNPDLTA